MYVCSLRLFLPYYFAFGFPRKPNLVCPGWSYLYPGPVGHGFFRFADISISGSLGTVEHSLRLDQDRN